MSEIEPLTDTDIMQLMTKYNIPVKFIMYHDIKYHAEDLIDMLPCIILYELNHPIGHWVALFKNDEGLQYFDPTGGEPDEVLVKHFRNPFGRAALNADRTYILEWMDNNFPEIIFNEVELQPPNTNTCGYWVAVRLVFHRSTQDEFASAFNFIPTTSLQHVIVDIFDTLMEEPIIVQIIN